MSAVLRLLRLGAVALLALSLLGCKESQRRMVGGNPEATAVAVVNNERITQQEFATALKRFQKRWERIITENGTQRAEVRVLVLNQLIEGKLLDQEARRMGIDVSTPAMEARLEHLISPISRDDLLQSVFADEADMTQWLRKFHRRQVHRKLVESAVIARIRITQRELRAYYRRNEKMFEQPERVRVRHIAVNSRAQYNRIRRRLRRNEDFIKLVRAYSITPDRRNDGDLGYVVRGVLPSEFDQAIFKLTTVGSVAAPRNPVQTQLGYHIFKLEGRRNAEKLSFNEAVPRIREILLLKKQEQAYRKWIQELRRKATVTIDEQLLRTEFE